MIEIFKKKGGQVVNVPIENYKFGQNLALISITAPTDDEFVLISKITKLPLSDLRISLSNKETPRVEYNPDFIQIQLRTASLTHFGTTRMSAIFIKKNTLLFIHKTRLQELTPESISKFLSNDIRFLLFNIISIFISRFDNILDKIEDQIDDLEQKILKKEQIDITQSTFTKKKTLIFLRKALKNNTEVIKTIRQDHYKKLKPTPLFDDLYYDIKSLVDLEETNRDRLSEILNIHLSSASHSLNEVMKGLTVIASIIAFPMLITGIYGMNFQNMPEVKWDLGYYFAIWLIVFSAAASLGYLKHKKYI